MRKRDPRKRGLWGNATRRGAAVSELAICLPITTLLVFGGIETADMIHLKGYLRNISYEGGREAARYNSTNSDVLTCMNSLLQATAVEGAEITIVIPGGANDIRELERGEQITIRLEAPAALNTVGPLELYSSRIIVAESIVVRE